jgi:hypothetical protein
MDQIASASFMAGYWDRIANHMSGAMQYLAAIEDLTGTPHDALRERLVAVQAEVSLNRRGWQERLPQGRG